MILALPHRAVLKVSGEAAKSFLNGLITADMEKLPSFGALLSPQGKLLVDFFIIEHEEAFYLDCPTAQAEMLFQKLNLYKLRAKVTISKESLHIFALTQDETASGIVFQDPRAKAMGKRLITPIALPTTGEMQDYTRLRVAACLPEGGEDFTYGETFPHDVNMDDFGVLSYTKGCYVGQEIVARMHHRGSARKRVKRFFGEVKMPATGSDILSNDVVVGQVGTIYGDSGLALVRVDKLLSPVTAQNIPLFFVNLEND